MNRTLFFIASLFICNMAFCQSNEGKKGISFSPVILPFSLGEGMEDSIFISITNNNSTTCYLSTSIQDWERDTIGKHIFFDPGTHDRSCAHWIVIDTGVIVIPAGQTKAVKVMLKAPDSKKSFDEVKWTMLCFESAKNRMSNYNKDDLTVVNSVRVGAHIYQTPPNPDFVKKLAILDMAKLTDTKYRVAVGNIGDFQVYCKTKLELKPATGPTVKLQEIDAPLFPDQLRYFDFNLPSDIPSGTYKAIATIYIDYDEKSSETLERTIEIK